MADSWDDDDDEDRELPDDDDDDQGDDESAWEPDIEVDENGLPVDWDDWFEFDWAAWDDAYGEYEEYAVSADYEG